MQNKFDSKKLRQAYLDFFKKHGHAVIPSASLIPENDPTVLFTTAGMHPLVPYLLGEKHPQGKRLTDVQKCVRTGDIDEVGDSSHCTFFEMLGNWSLGDYFKEEAIKFSYEFLTSKEYLGIDKDRLAVSVFAGDSDCPRDTESAEIWQKCGIAKDKIFYLPKKNNWWGPAGTTGPCGPDTEMFIDRGYPKCCADCSPACDCGKYIEIWNDVFMQYFKNAEGKYLPLSQKNVDTGMGLERTLCILNGTASVYETDLFDGARTTLESLSGKKYSAEKYTKLLRVVLDHMRTAVFMIGDPKGITPSNTDQGYVLRRIIRRAIRFAKKLDLKQTDLSKIAACFIEKYKDVYPELLQNKEKIISEINKEEEKFTITLENGLREFEKVLKYINTGVLNGKTAFRLYDTFGFPFEITEELARENGLTVDKAAYEACFAEHQKKSQAGSEQRFKGGLADNQEETARLHTATHLLLAGLKKLLSNDINQRGSNITAERLRLDFNFDRPLTDGEIKALEDFVNKAINDNIPVTMKEMKLEEAKAQNATGIFESKYNDVVKVYTVKGVSCEICGGPHAQNTGELKKFKITKEQSSSAGIRRIRGEIEN